MNTRTIKSIGIFLVLFILVSGLPSSGFIRSAKAQANNDTAGSARPQTTFINSTPITINDNAVANPYPSTIAASGLLGTVTHVKVTINGYSHTFSNDVGIVLVGPTGAALLVQDGCGSDPDMINVTYSIDDSGATQLPDTTAWPAGTYKPANYIFPLDSFPAPGPLTAYGNPGPLGGGTATFASTFNGTAPNGNWRLFVVDFVGGDAGSIAGGWSIDITTNAVHTQHVVDYNGDGKTDFSIARAVGANINWYNYDGIAPLPAGFSSTQWGLAAFDFIVTEDFDGDNHSDITVWREAAAGAANFYILQSSNGTVRAENFGQTGDDPAVVGDYDGDGRADPAVYRCPDIAAPAGQCYFFYRGSLNNPSGAITFVPFGFGHVGDFFPYVGDFDGDGKNDVCVQRTDPGSPGHGQFVLVRSSDNVAEFIGWGLSSDFLIPGDYDGDGKTDICVRRTVGSNRFYYVLTRTGATIAVQWGLTGDVSVPGDYDGDGRTDFAVWRGSTTPGASVFYILQSGTGSLRAVSFGQCPTGNCDYPVASWPVH